MDQFIADVEGGKVDAVIFYNANPVYDHPKGAKLGAALKNVTLTVRLLLHPTKHHRLRLTRRPIIIT